MKCSECDLDFGNEKILNIHIKIMHKERQTSNQPVKTSTDSNMSEKIPDRSSNFKPLIDLECQKIVSRCMEMASSNKGVVF